jgi:hypothetical protein
LATPNLNLIKQVEQGRGYGDVYSISEIHVSLGRAANSAGPLIRLARQVQVRERAVDVRLDDLAGRADVGFVELVIGDDAEQRQADADFVFEDLEEAHHAFGASGGEAVDIEPAAGDRVRTEGGALTTSVPRLMPPSTMMRARPPTASATSGNTSIDPTP